MKGFLAITQGQPLGGLTRSTTRQPVHPEWLGRGITRTAAETIGTDQLLLFAVVLLCSSDEKGPATNSHSTVTEFVVPVTDSPAWCIDPLSG